MKGALGIVGLRDGGIRDAGSAPWDYTAGSGDGDGPWPRPTATPRRPPRPESPPDGIEAVDLGLDILMSKAQQLERIMVEMPEHGGRKRGANRRRATRGGDGAGPTAEDAGANGQTLALPRSGCASSVLTDNKDNEDNGEST